MHGIRMKKPYLQQAMLVVLAFMIMVGVSFWYVKDIVQQQMRINGDEVIASANATVRSLLSETEVSLISVLYPVERLIDDGESTENVVRHIAALSDWLVEKTHRYFALSGIYGYVRGEYVDGGRWIPPADYVPEKRPWYIGAIQKQGKTHYTDPYVDAETGRVIISVSREVRGKEGTSGGVVAIDFDISAVTEYIEGLHPVGGGYGVLINDRLELVAHRNPSLTGKPFAQVGPDYAKLAKMLDTDLTLSAVEFTDYDGVKSVIFLSRMFNDWRVGTITPLAVYYDKVYTMAAVLSAIGFTMMSILCLLLLKLYVAKEAADEKNLNKTSFMARISQEVRTPIKAIMSMAEMIQREEERIPQKAHEHALNIKQASISVLTLINDVLDLSKIESGRLEIVPGPYMFTSLMNDVINITRARLGEKPLIFLAYIDSSLPNLLIGDEVRVRQILLNLLSNAIKYTDAGSVSLSVHELSRTDVTVMLTISITDTGRGIKRENQDRMFGDFVRMDLHRNRGVDGSGLGLAITQNLVRQMDGDIQVSSMHGQGSTFTVRLPQRYESNVPFARVNDPEAKSVLICGKTVAYVDSLGATLENLGVPHTLATTESALLKALTEREYAFFFLEAALYSKAQELFVQLPLQLDGQIILFTNDPNGVDLGFRTLIMPVCALQVANVLNNLPEHSSVGEESETVQRFKASEARVLVVDDIKTNLKVTENLLLPYELQADYCLSGKEAVERVCRHDYDLVLMDHIMPDMDGIATMQAIRALEGERFKALPIIAMSANAFSGIQEMFLNKGMNDFLPKPIDPVKLDALLGRWIPKAKQAAIMRSRKVRPGFVLPHVEGLDAEIALRRFGNEPTTYLDVLSAFVAHTPPVLEQMRGVNGSNLEDYANLAHDVRSGASGIGAPDIEQRAIVLEKAAKSGDEQAVLQSNSAFIIKTEALIRDLEAMLDMFTPHGEKGQRGEPEKALLAALLRACRRYDLLAMDATMIELERYTYVSHQDLVEWLREQIDTLEYDNIRERLEDLLQ